MVLVVQVGWETLNVDLPLVRLYISASCPTVNMSFFTAIANTTECVTSLRLSHIGTAYGLVRLAQVNFLLSP